jgi:antitoxin (DNA-binding transcriptional repressor) of toxin-antitoxin stability system
MKKAKVGELKKGLSRYLAHVKAGGTVVVFERDRPVAHIACDGDPGSLQFVTLDAAQAAAAERRGSPSSGHDDMSTVALRTVAALAVVALVVACASTGSPFHTGPRPGS